MKRTGMGRRLDELGRIVIPMEIRKSLNISSGDLLDISVENGAVILKKSRNVCIICGNESGLEDFEGHKLCKKCIEKINLL